VIKDILQEEDIIVYKIPPPKVVQNKLRQLQRKEERKEEDNVKDGGTRLKRIGYNGNKRQAGNG